MADNVFDKLDEQAQVLARIDKNTSDNSSAVDEMLKTNPSELLFECSFPKVIRKIIIIVITKRRTI